MLFLTRGRWRTATTAVAAGALAATTLAFAGSSAQAAEETGSALKWNISQQFVDHLSTRTTADGATFAQGAYVFPFAGEQVVDGETVYEYGGSVRGAFGFGGTEFYSVTVTDPVITVDTEGTGEITAVVSATNAAAQGNPADETEPARVVVAEFTDAVEEAGRLNATPNWEGVLPAGSAEAVDLGIAEGKPLDGKAFHPEFLGQLTSGVRAHFYASGSGSDGKKNPGVLNPTPKVDASVAGSGKRITVDVAATGVFPDAGAQGYVDGVYVGFAAKQNVFTESEGQEDGMKKYIDSAHIGSAEIAGGAFVHTFTIPKKKLAKGQTYAVYTWTAHGNPIKGDSQYTETIVKVPGLPKNNSRTVIKLKKKPTTKKKGNARIIVKGVAGVKASGKVKVTLKKGKQTKKFTRKLNKKGKATVKLPKLKKGKWKLVAKYTADKNFKKSKKVMKFKVKK